MNDIEVVAAKSFNREAKRLVKRYRSLADEIELLINSLKKNPFQGKDLGGGVHKIRLSISSKGKGKSGGARIISYVDVLLETMSGRVSLLTIYDKSEQSTVSDKEIAQLLRDAGLK